MNDIISLSCPICEILIGPSHHAAKCCEIELGEKIFCQFKAYFNSIFNMLDNPYFKVFSGITFEQIRADE